MPREVPDIAAEAAAITRELASRETLLPTVSNPEIKVDALCRLEAECVALDLPMTVIYVPDKLLVAEGGFRQFAGAFKPEGQVLEARAIDILRAMVDELIPRWIQLRLGTGSHRVLLEDRQPKWSNDALLNRLDPF